jgi:hypothetical protein
MGRAIITKFDKGTTRIAREKTDFWVKENFPSLHNLITTGLPEYDDRIGKWRVSLNAKNAKLNFIGEVRFDKNVTTITESTNKELIIERVIKHKGDKGKNEKVQDKSKLIYPAPIPNKLILGDSKKVLKEFPKDTAQLIF